jgi:large subunit ribosomal protein L5
MAKEKEKKAKEQKEESAAPKKAKKDAAESAPVSTKGPTPRLKERYRNEILPSLLKREEFGNAMAVPRLKKITLNMGLGEATKNIKIIDSAMDEIGKITGQKPVIRRAKKAISSFKLRQGMPIGVSVTLRGDRMYEFLDRLISIALPRVRDFRGLPPDAFDGRGNYTMGLRDQTLFPEIDYAKVDKMRGLNVTIVTSARNDDQARTLLIHLGLPFRKN